MRDEDKRSLALVVAGALSGYILAASYFSLFFGALLIIGLLIVVVLLLLYGVGIPQTAYHKFLLKNRWKKPLKIGVLNDMKWDTNNKEIWAWSDFSPDIWKNALETYAKSQNVPLNVELIDVNKSFGTYTAILNPYGGVYPEQDLKNMTTLEKIICYVREGALFVNIADIPAYWAYNSDLKRKVDTTTTVYGAFASPNGIQIIGEKPFETAVLMKRLDLRVLGFPQKLPQSIPTQTPNGIYTERAAIVESNVTTCLQTSRQPYGDGQMHDFSGMFFVKFGEGDFLFSLLWINAEYHNQQAKEAIRDEICRRTIDKLDERKNNLTTR